MLNAAYHAISLFRSGNKQKHFRSAVGIGGCSRKAPPIFPFSPSPPPILSFFSLFFRFEDSIWEIELPLPVDRERGKKKGAARERKVFPVFFFSRRSLVLIEKEKKTEEEGEEKRDWGILFFPIWSPFYIL